MFKFFKSKKGFTLVELMIVVVIMAILVAVAVPIFSAVTKNARIKTCEANRREIVSQVNGFLMGSVDTEQHTDSGSFVVKPDGSVTEGMQADPTYTEEMFKGLFQEIPVCPNGGIFTVSLIAAVEGGVADTTATVIVACNSHTDEAGVAAKDQEDDPSDTAYDAQE